MTALLLSVPSHLQGQLGSNLWAQAKQTPRSIIEAAFPVAVVSINIALLFAVQSELQGRLGSNPAAQAQHDQEMSLKARAL